MEQTRIEKMERIGDRWQKNGMDRIYFNDLHKYIGLELHHYNTGNISSASYRGDKISNCEAKRIMGRIAGKLWFDVVADQYKWTNVNDRDAQNIIDEINRQIQEG